MLSKNSVWRLMRPMAESSLKRYASKSIIIDSKFSRITEEKYNLPQFIWQDVEKWADKPMITCGNNHHSITFGNGRKSCTKFGNALIDKCGLKKGDVVGLLLPNLPEYVVSIHGALEAGLIVTFVNPLYTAEEVQRQFENANVQCCITIPELLPVMETVVPSLSNYKGTILVNSKTPKASHRVFSYEDLVASGSTNPFTPVGPDEVSVLPYSSGTTGLPKGVMLSHQNCVINIRQLGHPEVLNHRLPTDNFQETVLTVLPFFHIYGFNIIMNISLYRGAHLVTVPKFTPDVYINCLKKFKPTKLFVVPSLLLFLTSHPGVKKEDLLTVEEIVSGAAPATKSLIENFRNKFDHSNLIIRQGYGMTELSPCALITPLAAPAGKEGAAGKLVCNTQARIVNLSDGSDQEAFKSGELYIKGPQIMKGYWKNDKATKETVDGEGWLHTGDVAYYDDDEFFFIIDRTKELIKVKGNQVSPTELESIIMKLNGVTDVAVVGVPDPLADEVPKAFVVVRKGVTLTAQDVAKYVEGKVVNYKRLTGGVSFIDAIPRNAAGKIMRNELKILRTN